MLLLVEDEEERDSVTDAEMDPDLERREEGTAAGLRSDFVDAAVEVVDAAAAGAAATVDA